VTDDTRSAPHARIPEALASTQEASRVGPVRPGIPGITDILLEAGVVTPEQIQTALEYQRSAGVRVGEALVELGAVSEHDIAWALARQLGFTYLDLTPAALDLDLVRSFPAGLLRRLLAVPLLREDNALSAAFGDPTDREAIAELEHVAGMRVVPNVAVPSTIYRVLDQLARAWRFVTLAELARETQRAL